MSTPDLATFRGRLWLTQADAARLFSVDHRTWQRWEYGERPMEGPAMVLLRILTAHPELAKEITATPR